MPETAPPPRLATPAYGMPPPSALTHFSQNVRRLRLDAQLSQAVLAERCTKYKKQIAQIENGSARVTLSMVYVLASALQVDPGQLLREPLQHGPRADG